MKKTLLAVLIVASVVGAWAVTSTPEVDAIGCIRCMPGGVAPAPPATAWGMGATCAEARANAIAAATAAIPGSCDSCGNIIPILIKDCYGSNPVKADYRVAYKCNVNLCQ